MKIFQVTIKNEEYETYLVDAPSAEEANKIVNSAMDDASLWDGKRSDIEPYCSGRGDFWEVEPEMTEEVSIAQ